MNDIHNKVVNLDLRWIRGKTENWSDTIREVEHIAAEMLAANEDEDETETLCLEFYQKYLERVRDATHSGDCGICRSWDTAPITCDACVYDEYMLKAWAKKKEQFLATVGS